MALMTEILETEPSSLEEEVEKHVLVDVMVEEYESIVNNIVWEVIPIPEDKPIVGLR